MIPVSTAFRDTWRSGTFRVEKTAELYLPVNPTAVTATSEFSADFPASAVLDGDRTELNAGAPTGLYPPPAGPENFIGRGMWKSSAVPVITAPQKVFITIGTQSVGRVLIYAHPTEGGCTRFGFTVKATSASSEVPVTGIRRARAWEMHNGRSTVTPDTQFPGLGILNVAAVNTFRPSIPSVIEVVFTANVSGSDATGQLVLLVGEAGSPDGRARCCEIELFRMVDVTDRLPEIEISHGADIRNRSIVVRQLRARARNAQLSAGDTYPRITADLFSRPTTGQASIDLRPELAVFAGINGESVQLGRFAIDNTEFDHVKREIEITGRGRTEQVLFDRPISAWRRNIDLDDACILAWTLGNNPAGLTVIDRNPTTLDPFNPGEQGWQEVEALRQAAQDRGAFVDGEGVLRFLNPGTIAGSLLTALCTPHTEIWSTNATPEFRGIIIPNDMMFFDPANGFRFYFQDRTFRTYKPHPNQSPDPWNLDDCDDDRISTWDIRSPFAGRTSIGRMLNGAKTNPGPNEQPNAVAVPLVMARRPGTNDYYFFTSSVDPKAETNNNGLTTAVVTGWTITGGVAVQILAAQTLPAGTFVTAAAFIGNVLYWWEAQHGTVFTPSDGDALRQHRLKRWDVTTAFAPVTVLTENLSHVRSMVSVGTWLLWVQLPGYFSGLRYGNNSTFYDPGGGVEVWNTTEPLAWRSFAARGQPRRIILTTSDPATAAIIGSEDTLLRWRNTIAPPVTGAGAVWTTQTTLPAGGRSFGAIAQYGAGVLVAAFEGPVALRFWDLANGSTPTLFAYGASPTHVQGVLTALAVSSTTWYGRRPIIAMESGTTQLGFRSAVPPGRLFFWLVQESVEVPDETVSTGPFIELAERVSYEIGGAVGGASAIDMTIHQRAVVAGEQIFSGVAGDPVSPHLIRLEETTDPASINPAPVRRHARYPKVAGGPTILGTIGIDTPRTLRQFRSDSMRDDPALFSVDTLDVRWITDEGVAIAVAEAVLKETRTGTRMLDGVVPIAPHIEIGDTLKIEYRQRTNTADTIVSGLFRVNHITHTMSVGDSDAENRTQWELVSVST